MTPSGNGPSLDPEVPVENPAQATREELTARCGHECLNQPDHDGPHFYGYRMGRYSYEGLLAENERLTRIAETVQWYVAQHGWCIAVEGEHGPVCRDCHASLDDDPEHREGCQWFLLGDAVGYWDDPIDAEEAS